MLLDVASSYLTSPLTQKYWNITQQLFHPFLWQKHTSQTHTYQTIQRTTFRSAQILHIVAPTVFVQHQNHSKSRKERDFLEDPSALRFGPPTHRPALCALWRWRSKAVGWQRAGGCKHGSCTYIFNVLIRIVLCKCISISSIIYL